MLKKLLVGIATIAMLFSFSVPKADAFLDFESDSNWSHAYSSAGGSYSGIEGVLDIGANATSDVNGWALYKKAKTKAEVEANLYADFDLGLGWSGAFAHSNSTMDMHSKATSEGKMLLGFGSIDLRNEVGGFGFVNGGTLALNFQGESAYTFGQAGGEYHAIQNTHDGVFFLGYEKSTLEGFVYGTTKGVSFVKDFGNTSIAGAHVESESIAYTTAGWKDHSHVNAIGAGSVGATATELNGGAFAQATGSASYSYNIPGKTFAAGSGQASTFNMATTSVSNGHVSISATSISSSSAGGI